MDYLKRLKAIHTSLSQQPAAGHLTGGEIGTEPNRPSLYSLTPKGCVNASSGPRGGGYLPTKPAQFSPPFGIPRNHHEESGNEYAQVEYERARFYLPQFIKECG